MKNRVIIVLISITVKEYECDLVLMLSSSKYDIIIIIIIIITRIIIINYYYYRDVLKAKKRGRLKITPRSLEEAHQHHQLLL